MDERQKRRGVIRWGVRIIGWSMFAATFAFVAIAAYVCYDNQETERQRFRGETRSIGFAQAERAPKWSDDGRYIVANLGNSIYRVEFPGGEVETVLKGEEVGYYSPALAPDGRLAYNEYDPDNHENLVRVLDLAEGQPRTLTTDELRVSPLSWSPDGSRLLYRHRQETGGPLVMMDGGGTPVAVWREDGIVFRSREPAWSHDSQRLALRKVDRPGVSLVITQRDGVEIATVDQSDEEGTLSAPGWSDDGRLYYAKRERRDRATRIILYSTGPDGWERQPVADMTAQAWTIPGETRSGNLPTPEPIPEWRLTAVHSVNPSPDGQRMLLFAESAEEGGDNTSWGLYLWEMGEPALARLLVWSGTDFASWSPDGQWIAVCDPRDGKLFVVNAQGEGYRLLLQDDANAHDLSR